MVEKKIVIVGGSSGIGLELVERLASSGMKPTVWSRRATPRLRELGIAHESVDVEKPLPPDISAPPEILHGLAFCAGNIRLRPFRQLKDEEYIEDFNLNVLGAVRVIRHFLPALVRSGNAGIVLFSSVAVRQGMSYHASIAAAKAGVEGLTRSLAAEFSSRRIRVNAVAPSLTDTRLSERLLSGEEKRKQAAARHPLKRFGEPADIAATAEFLLSDRAGWITGQVISVDGGMSSVKLF